MQPAEGPEITRRMTVLSVDAGEVPRERRDLRLSAPWVGVCTVTDTGVSVPA